MDGYRHRPDGTELRWKQIGVMDLMDDRSSPYFVQWLTGPDQHPGAGGGLIRLETIELAGDAYKISAWLGEPGDHPLKVEWVNPMRAEERTGIGAVHFDTPRGPGPHRLGGQARRVLGAERNRLGLPGRSPGRAARDRELGGSRRAGTAGRPGQGQSAKS